MRKALSLLLLFCLMLLAACGQPRSEESYSLTLWYVEGDPLAPTLTRLAQEYNRARGKDTLALTLRAWVSEEQLLHMLQSSAPPALVLCPHTLAFTLDEGGLLQERDLVTPIYSDWLCKRSDSIGHGFYPIGFSLPLLCTRERAPESLHALLRSAAAQGRETGLPALYVDRFAPLFYQTLLDTETEFHADPAKDMGCEDYVNLYNALLQCRFDHGLAFGEAVDTPWRIVDSPTLTEQALDGFTLAPLSNGPLLAEGRGLAVTARDGRMQRALPDFFRYLTQSGRLVRTALDAGLIPAAQEAFSPATPLEAALLSLMERPLHLPDARSQYYVNLNSFEEEFIAALELLH